MLEAISIQSIILAAILKLSSSLDDLVWLPPYMRKNKLRSALAYTSVLTGIVILAYLISAIGTAIIPNSQLLKIGSGVLLVCFSLFYLRKDHDWNGSSVLSITFFGSLDELGIFTGMFSSGYIGVISALTGTLIAAVIVLLIVEFFTRTPVIMSLLEKVPVWIIIGLIGIYSVIDGAFL